jgi:hypothetical protein
MPFNIFDQKYMDILVQAYLYRQIYVAHTELSILKFSECLGYAQSEDARYTSAKHYFRKAYGLQHLASPFYICIGDLQHLYDEGLVKAQHRNVLVYVNAIELFSRYVLMHISSTLDSCDDESRIGDIVQPSYKQVTAKDNPMNGMTRLMAGLVMSRENTPERLANNPAENYTTQQLLSWWSNHTGSHAWARRTYEDTFAIVKKMAASLLYPSKDKSKFTTEEVFGRVCHTRINANGPGMVVLNSSFNINQ